MRIFILFLLLCTGWRGWADPNLGEMPLPETPVIEVESEKEFRLKTQEAEVREQNERRDRVLRALFSLNKKIKALVTERGAIQRDKEALEASLEDLNLDIEKTEKAIQTQRVYLGKRLQAMGMMASNSWIKFFFSSQSANDLDRNLKVLKIISVRDRELIRQLDLDVRYLKSAREKAVARQKLVADKREIIAKKEARLLSEISVKNRLLLGVQKQRLFSVKKLQALQQQVGSEVYREAGVFDALSGRSFSTEKGLLPWPVEQGQLKRRFGLHKSQEHSYVLQHRGVFFESKHGAKVRAVAEGTVIFKSEVKGYEELVVVDHGDHYYSVYGNLDQALVKTGQQIRKGEVIANSGYSSLNETSGLYFEIRHFSEPYDPAHWLKGLSL